VILAESPLRTSLGPLSCRPPDRSQLAANRSPSGFPLGTQHAVDNDFPFLTASLRQLFLPHPVGRGTALLERSRFRGFESAISHAVSKRIPENFVSPFPCPHHSTFFSLLPKTICTVFSHSVTACFLSYCDGSPAFFRSRPCRARVLHRKFAEVIELFFFSLPNVMNRKSIIWT